MGWRSIGFGITVAGIVCSMFWTWVGETTVGGTDCSSTSWDAGDTGCAGAGVLAKVVHGSAEAAGGAAAGAAAGAAGWAWGCTKVDQGSVCAAAGWAWG